MFLLVFPEPQGLPFYQWVGMLVGLVVMLTIYFFVQRPEKTVNIPKK